MDTHRGQLILHRRAIGRGIGIGEAQHAAILGMQHLKLHALGQLNIGRNKAKTVRLFAARGLDIGDPAWGGASMPSSKLSVMTCLR